jgi:tetratricopeptide (TPR) repeat protein
MRLNNRGVALMGQQFTERAADTFAEAFKKTPSWRRPRSTKALRCLTLQKLDEAKKWLLQKGHRFDPDSAQAWYNLGLAQHAGNELERSAPSFQQAAKLDPQRRDSYYFEGVCYQEMKQFDKAIAIFQQALQIDPLHASAEFVLARACSAPAHRGGEGALQALSAPDQHQDFGGHRAGLR